MNVLMNKIQVSLNFVDRSILGCKRSEKKRVEEILSESTIPSLYRIVVETIGIECWKALHIRDAPNLPLTPLGTVLCANYSADPARKTRATTSNSLPPHKSAGECVHVVGLLTVEFTLAPAHRAHVERGQVRRR